MPSRKQAATTLIFVAILAGGAAAFAGRIGASSPGCATVAAGTIVESSDFVPGSAQRGPIRPAAAINPTGSALQLPDRIGSVPESLDRMPLEFAVDHGDLIKLYYLGSKIDSAMTGPDFFAAGGIRLERSSAMPGSQGPTFAETLVASAGGRALPVDIGPYAGALVYADPTPTSDQRTHNVYWADGSAEYALIGLAGPEHMVNLARGLVCGFN